jgi:hypothetical protein
MAVNLAVGSKAPSYNLLLDAGGHISSPDFKRHKLATPGRLRDHDHAGGVALACQQSQAIDFNRDSDFISQKRQLLREVSASMLLCIVVKQFRASESRLVGSTAMPPKVITAAQVL